MAWIALIGLLSALVFTGDCSQRDVVVNYPIRLLTPVTARVFKANVTRDQLTCFGNSEYEEPTYLNTFRCLLTFSGLYTCRSIWGSRTVVVETDGSVELFRVNRIPQEDGNKVVRLVSTRWMQLSALSPLQPLPGVPHIQSVVQHMHAEPIYLCARSNQWKHHIDTEPPSGTCQNDLGTSSLKVHFRPAYFREKDWFSSRKKMLLHIPMILVFSSTWLLPYFAALLAFSAAFYSSLTIYFIALAVATFVIFFTPFMFTRNNRHLAHHYIQHFISRHQEEDTRLIIRRGLPVFQAIYFSSVVVCLGSIFFYFLYLYCGITREWRNNGLKGCLAVACSWCLFCLCRHFDKLFSDWMWVVLAIALTDMMREHVNAMSYEELLVTIVIISFGVKYVVRASGMFRLIRQTLSYSDRYIRHNTVYSIIQPFVSTTSKSTKVILTSGTAPTNRPLDSLFNDEMSASGETSGYNSDEARQVGRLSIADDHASVIIDKGTPKSVTPLSSPTPYTPTIPAATGKAACSVPNTGDKDTNQLPMLCEDDQYDDLDWSDCPSRSNSFCN